MFVASNLLRDLLPYFKRKLKAVYDEREIESIFFLICENRFGLKKMEALGGDKRLTESELLEFRDLVNRLSAHEPVQYLLGNTVFYGLTFNVTPDVLIPRPETEELVDLVIKKYKHQSNLRVLDIGTGSGCIAIALQLHLKESDVTAVDISENAIQLARENALQNKAIVQFLQMDIFSNQVNSLGIFDVIISNPPYIPDADKNAMHKNVLNFEPHLALFVPDSDPLKFYKTILDFAQTHLSEKGEVYFEIHPDYGQAILAYARSKHFTNAVLVNDLSGKNRFAIISN
ncbi:MAG: peptide chain release factor N(5)-glutamine methyltransferase [Bacteroidetes bacterium]|nr:peptide chain release factor N(5)-glutamine methyltransferase [Bacteroidota bacterium]